MLEKRIKDLLPPDLGGVTYIGELPSTPTNAASILLFGGSDNLEYFGSGSMMFPVAKIVIRHQSYESAYAWANSFKNTLHRYHDEYFLSILMQGSIRYLGRDELKFHTFQVIFNIKVKE